MSRSGIRRFLVALLLLLALALRFAPLHDSPLPYNVDGFSAARTAQGILEEAAWRPGGYEPSMPLAFMLLAQSALVTGLPVLDVAQPHFSLVGCTAVLAAWAAARRAMPGRAASVGALAVLGLLGFYVYFTSVAMKQLLGFVFIPLALSLLLTRRGPRALALGGVLLVALPLTHHLSTLLFLLCLAMGLVSWRAQEPRAPLAARLALLALAGTWAGVWFWSVRTGVSHWWSILLRDAWLLASITILLATLLRLRPRPWPAGRFLALAVPLAGGLLLAANTLSDLFAGGTRTPPLATLVALPYVGLLAVATWGLGEPSLRGDRFAYAEGIAAGVCSWLAFTLLRGLDATSFYLATRGVDFVDPALAVGAGAALAASTARGASREALARGGTSHPEAGPKLRHRALVAVLVVALPAATLPAAVAGDAVLTFRNTVSPAEFAATGWAAGAVEGPLASDTRLAHVLHGYWQQESPGNAAWTLSRGGAPEGPILGADSWATRGGEAAPLGVFPVDVAAWSASGNLVYANGHARLVLGR